MRIITLTFATLAILGLASCKQEQKKETTKVEDMETTNGIDKTNMDTTIAPGADFFMFANGGWIKKNPIPEEYSRFGAFEVLNKKNQEQIKGIIDEVSKEKDAAKGSASQQIRDFYNSGMDTNTIEKLGMTPIVPLLKEIDNLKESKEILVQISNMNFRGSYPMFALYAAQDDKNSTRIIANLYQAGLGLPDRDYYLGTGDREKEIRAKYEEHLSKMFVLSGFSQEEAAKMTKVVMTIETRLAKASSTRLALRDPQANYNLMKMADITKRYKLIDFKAYTESLGLANLEEINVCQPKFFDELNKMMKDVKLEDWKVYLKWNVINSSADMLTTAFEKQNFDFYSTVLSGVTKQKARWERIIGATNETLGEAVGKLYVEKYFPKEAKTKMEDLVKNLRAALNESINNLVWMTPETKVKAQEKLAAMNLKVGYPNKWIDYSSIDINPNTYIQNIWNCTAFSVKRELNKIGKPVDREEWGMTPQTVNAYYSPNMNEIVFPAAILQAPFFNINADDAVNYGAIGVVIGHEMTHGFDDQGCQYDKDGNLINWWTAEDAKKFKENTQILIEQFNNFTMLDSLKVDGALTLGENIADNGGLSVAYAALMKSYEAGGKPQDKDGLTFQQRFVISYAQVWRQSIRPEELMRRLKEDVHSPGEARVNGALQNAPYFYEAFGIKEGDALYLAPEKRAKVW